MNSHYNLPPGTTPRMIDGPPDTRTSDERAREWFQDNRGIPPDDYTYEYVRNRIIRDDEPGPDEVLRWIEEQVVKGNLDPVDDLARNRYEPRDRH